MGPQAGFTGSACSMQTNLFGGRLTQNGLQDRANPFFGVFGPFREAANFPQAHKNTVNRELRPQEAKPSKVQNLRWANQFPKNSLLAPSCGRNGTLPDIYVSTRVRTQDLALLGLGTAPKNQ